MTEEELRKIAEQIKSELPIELLDELERRYNDMLREVKNKQSGSTTNPES
jgi:ribonuclease HIII